MNVEICIDSVESAIAAARGGANRVELCSALSEGGITPSAGLISAVRAAVKIQVFVIIRPRGGDFVYSDAEMDVMARDIEEVKARGVDGVVLGMLTPGGEIEVERTRRLVELARPLGVTFHRAFDVCNDLGRGLEDVITTGADRILTSGGAADAMQGMDRLAQLQRDARGRISIMAGGGIRPANVRALTLRTGLEEVHSSLSRSSDESAEMGQSGKRTYLVFEDDVRAFRAAIEATELDAESEVRR
ncbi:copper homeostasis protein CutC [Occallatibacter savannae]|uniref:copper homeostasis protein CutC n=1 Tax=Occallatibacter savannae TaxID=1002691 RepID=UPI000D6995B7|nr:copper homeostasis protein CutC [Occallatibacter savannae]